MTDLVPYVLLPTSNGECCPPRSRLTWMGRWTWSRACASSWLRSTRPPSADGSLHRRFLDLCQKLGGLLCVEPPLTSNEPPPGHSRGWTGIIICTAGSPTSLWRFCAWWCAPWCSTASPHCKSSPPSKPSLGCSRFPSRSSLDAETSLPRASVQHERQAYGAAAERKHDTDAKRRS
jgi:hypothetical protein